MIEIIWAARSIIPAAELTFPSLHMYLYPKLNIQLLLFCFHIQEGCNFAI